MRGLKRKFGNSSNSAAQEDNEKTEYKQNLSNFQTAARQRESIRLKNHCLLPNNSTPGFWERHLSEKIHVETQMIKGTAKFLTACKNQEQTLEAAKRLQLGKLRLGMLRYELNKLKRGRGSPSVTNVGLTGMKSRPSYAGVSISDIRIPLMWKRKDHLNDVGDSRRFAVFCLARIGAQIYDSALVCPIDRSHTDINLSDVFLFNKISAHFEVTVEVYAKHLSSNFSTSSLVKDAEAILVKTPHKLVQSISKAIGRKLLMTNAASIFANHDQDLDVTSSDKLSEHFNIGPQFELIASASLNLDNCSKDVETHELYVVDSSSDNCPPLFGGICCRLAAMPYCCEEAVVSGQISLLQSEQNSKESANTILDFSKPKSVFASLVDWKLSIWSSKSQKDSARRSILQIPIYRDTCILEKGATEITITNVAPNTETSTTWTVTFDDDDKENQQLWIMALLQHAADHRRWKIAATAKLQLGSLAEVDVHEADPQAQSKGPKRPRYTKSFKRTRSKLVMLYNQAGMDDELI